MIDGLKLTFSGEELRTLLEDRIADHNGAADHWRKEQTRTPESQTEDARLLPEHMCEYEEEGMSGVPRSSSSFGIMSIRTRRIV